MIRPFNFGFNKETASNNAFQKEGFGLNAAEAAIKEFDDFADLLKSKGVDVSVVQDTPEPYTPDSIFPNNWFSTHEDGTLVLYPMFAKNRRMERKPHVLDRIKEKFDVRKIVDLTGWEEKKLYLEGTGSMILDRENRLVYACSSPRTSEMVLEQFCQELDYEYFIFGSSDNSGRPVYHTNVMMSVASGFVVACLDSIKDIAERERFISLVEESDKEVIEITLDQMEQFAGNMLEIESNNGRSLLIMSSTAKKSLDDSQLEKFSGYCEIVAPDLTIIENNGGGSARCMIAEIFLGKKI
jgi:hypothetical protein